MPEISHFVSVWALIGGCWHNGKCQLSWTWTFWIWFATDDHFAMVSSPESDVEADQYKWFTMLWIHGRTSAQPFLLATASSFLHTPTKIIDLISTYFSMALNVICMPKKRNELRKSGWLVGWGLMVLSHKHGNIAPQESHLHYYQNSKNTPISYQICKVHIWIQIVYKSNFASYNYFGIQSGI